MVEEHLSKESDLKDQQLLPPLAVSLQDLCKLWWTENLIVLFSTTTFDFKLA